MFTSRSANLQQDLGNGPDLSVSFFVCFLYCCVWSPVKQVTVITIVYMCLHVRALINSLFWSSEFFISSPAGTIVNSSFQYAPLCQIANFQNVWPSVLIKSPEESCLYTCERACSVWDDCVQYKSIKRGSVYKFICQIFIIHVTNAKLFSVHQINKGAFFAPLYSNKDLFSAMNTHQVSW